MSFLLCRVPKKVSWQGSVPRLLQKLQKLRKMVQKMLFLKRKRVTWNLRRLQRK